ncbi:DNA (cytosine-5-)-methyltransferase [Bacillus velezensis]|uniref:DNA cytosine methyltransferase n=1 Tax=Bacillus TaxID=1386 RepID=UPI00083CCD0E|nr:MULTISPECIES: DNA (cytosine-5-)-methyltransferase [Bacillus]AWM42741.1 DNA (cytosine-5-)-methyltransferase [Bacillus amyloliquefaciens]MCE4941375.1 DNA (cytosine-5-)-methyltransferase [Bacillus velezensis]MDU0078135.1 DNA (cytosine-5-)-methyltransferase [Bacillus sp. IG2]MDU0103845.1 DNA (cytosine-5-)-methyltransferase [Bacillus sp. IS1]MDX7897420.1 DNA (cytosine-5-)-methyltransferase [Bacillus velezensis]
MIGYKWRLSDLKSVERNGLKVFSTFSCGGGSSMGYKLAGFELVGNCEIDPQMMKIYRKNHNPQHSFLMDIRKFNKIPLSELPEALFDLDVFDGSPPCSVFSISGEREDAWGKEKTFREGQAKQSLDDLFFEYLDAVERLKPKTFLAENVKGMIIGKAKGYVKLVIERAKEIGYDVQVFLLNAATMGVPQRRERVFFIGRRKDLNLPPLHLSFNESPILYGEFRSGRGSKLTETSKTYRRWVKRRPSDNTIGDITKRTEGKESNFNTVLVKNSLVPPTLASNSVFIRYDEPYYISERDIILMQSFPLDYDFVGASTQYVCGMSVPPIMMNRIAEQISNQWFK